MNAYKSSQQSGDEENFNAAVPGDPAHVYAPPSNTFSPEDYAAGRVISGRFRVEHVIGVGSMGIVLAAKHLELDERVAIKFIRAEMQRLPGVLSRFAREAKAAVSIKSEHVAQVFDVGTAEGIGPYIVMEYLEGSDLAQVLELEGRLPIRRAVHYIMQACEALAVAHSAGITHRDIKPENLFLTRQGGLERIKLLDFGISKATLTGKVFGDELAAAESACLLGTPLYMSPEQIRATAEVDHRADIWALGAVLYELLTAHSAFVADSVRQVWTRILETTPTPLTTYCPEAPPALQAVLERCLEKEPARRFQSVAELANELS
ncbi:MAG TPA: serine/threonine-protein kinase, partial [Polyangiaceae bacterium]|nr:serine/threonine-protein kinase [Polyangiaceae bacterium]